MTKLLLTHAILSREENHILVDFMSGLIYEFLGISESSLAFYHLGMRGSKYFSELGAPRDRLFAGEGLQYIVLRGDYFKNRIVLCPCLGGREGVGVRHVRKDEDIHLSNL